MVRTGYSVPRFPHSVRGFRQSLSGLFGPHLPPKACVLGFILSRASALLQRPMLRVPPDPKIGAASHEVLRPSSVSPLNESAYCPGPTRNAALPGLSQTFEGFILIEPGGLVSCHIRSWGSDSSRRFPSTDSSGLVTRWYLLDVSYPCIPLVANHPRPARTSRPQGVSSCESPLPMRGVFHPCSSPMPSRVFMPPIRSYDVPSWILGPAAPRQPHSRRLAAVRWFIRS